jgi:ethanolamine kinase
MQREERVWRGVARTLGHWHAILPVAAEGSRLDAGTVSKDVPDGGQGGRTTAGEGVTEETRREEAPGDMWAVMSHWAEQIPKETKNEKQIRERMKQEVESAFEELSTIEGLGGHKLVMGHCDLLAGNVLVLNPDDNDPVAKVQFIDYEYSVACNAAFDIALHFGEWPGFECDYTRTPTPKTRTEFVREYVSSWRRHRAESGIRETASEDDDVRYIFKLVDRFRGLPGLWFGLWALVQVHDSSEEFDYEEYAKLRLSEYWISKDVEPPLDVGEGNADPQLREDRWFGRKTKDRVGFRGRNMHIDG